MVKFRWCILGKFNPRPGTAGRCASGASAQQFTEPIAMHSNFLKHETCSTENLGKLRENDMFSSKLYFKVSSFFLVSLVIQGV